MPPRAEAVELVALLIPHHKRHVDPLLGHLAPVIAKASIRIFPAIQQLAGIACCLGPIDANPVGHLDRPPGMHVSAKQHLDLGLLQQPPQALPVRRINREVPVVILIGDGQVPGRLIHLFDEWPVVHHGDVMSRGRQVGQPFQHPPHSIFLWKPRTCHRGIEPGEADVPM